MFLLTNTTFNVYSREGEDPNAIPTFLPPPIFSRFDSMFTVIGKKVTKETDQEESETHQDVRVPESEFVDLQSLLRQTDQQPGAGREDEKKTDMVVGRFRKRRAGYGMASHFRDETVPQKPQPTAVKMLRLKFLDSYQEIMTSVSKI